MNHKIVLTTALLVVSAAGVANAQPVNEAEPNDTTGTAQFIPASNFPTGAVTITGTLAPGGGDTTPDGIDFYSFDFTSGSLVTGSVFDFTPDIPDDNDSLLGVFAPDGTLFDFDDDDGPGLLSSISFITTSTGRWSFAVSGFGDSDFNGDGHDENFDYAFVVSVVIPTPGSAALLGLGGLAMLRRRRD